MRIKIIGKKTGTVGNSQLHVRSASGRKYTFSKKPGEGYTYDAKTTAEAEDIFKTQSHSFAYYFIPVLEEAKRAVEAEKVGDLEGKSLEELKELCKKFGIKTVPQDKERSMTRLLEAFKLGAGE